MYLRTLLYVQLKWSTLLHPVLGEHQRLTGQCELDVLQGPRTDSDGNELAYFDKAFKALRKSIMDENWLKSWLPIPNLGIYCKIFDIDPYGCILDIPGMLESFLSFVLAYALKCMAFQKAILYVIITMLYDPKDW